MERGFVPYGRRHEAHLPSALSPAWLDAGHAGACQRSTQTVSQLMLSEMMFHPLIQGCP